MARTFEADSEFSRSPFIDPIIQQNILDLIQTKALNATKHRVPAFRRLAVLIKLKVKKYESSTLIQPKLIRKPLPININIASTFLE